ncbi:hypothetical protein NSA19_07705 [Actinomyces bowdenii]|uniref:hypothetical protein n=1 Tax=Actinomyces bowdenii TaxID=131109 RepID=UPI00214B4A63|nr:hypothetical protein [Actinomyces bowdenii]MCR2052733.1 hypothetical protein [Actinomyces bowdenii]
MNNTLNLALCLATILLVPQTLISLFPAEASGYVIISGAGVDPDELRQLGERAGIEVAQVRHITEFDEVTDESFSTTTVEILGYDTEDYIRPPLNPLLLPESIAYSGSTVQDDALGGWYAVGSRQSTVQFLSHVSDRWGDRIGRSGTLTPGLAVSTAISSEIGVSLLLTQMVLALVLALATASQLPSYRSTRLLGRSHTRLALHLLRNSLLTACRWLLLPLALLALLVAYDAYSSAVLSAHRMSAELIACCAGLTLAATLTGTLAGWAALATGSRRPRMAARPHHRIALLTYALALVMTWSFSTASVNLVVDVLQAQALRNQAQAQQSLPQATALSIWSVSETTFDTKAPEIESFVTQAQQEGRLILTWAIPNGSTEDGSGPPTLYLNNTAAAHYGLPEVTEHQVTLYRPRSLTSQDAALTQRIIEQAHFNAQHGASTSSITVTAHSLEEVSALLPENLPAVSFFLSSESIRTNDCLIAVVPDDYFPPDDYLSAITQGAAVLMDQSIFSLREDLREHHVEDLVARFDTVGADNTALRAQTTRTAALHALILLTAAAGAVVSAGLAARAWAQVRRRRREIESLLGQRQLSGRLLTASLITVPVLILAWPLLAQPITELVLTQAACALALIAAVVMGTRHTTARPTHPHRRRQARHD